jgi:anti-sigma factor RsiW
MQCVQVRKLLYSSQVLHSDKPAPVEAETKDAVLHLERCTACRQFFAVESELSQALRKRGPREAASSALREQVLSRIAAEREQAKRPSRWRLAHRRAVVLGLLVCLLGSLLTAAFWLRSRHAPESEQLASILVDDHARYQSPQVTSSDPGTVCAWFRGRIGFAVIPPRLSDTSMVGGRLCNLRGRPAALVVYRRSENVVSLFMLDGQDLELPREHLVILDERTCFVTSERGYSVVMWKQRGLLYGLISDMRGADLLQLSNQF